MSADKSSGDEPKEIRSDIRVPNPIDEHDFFEKDVYPPDTERMNIRDVIDETYLTASQHRIEAHHWVHRACELEYIAMLSCWRNSWVPLMCTSAQHKFELCRQEKTAYVKEKEAKWTRDQIRKFALPPTDRRGNPLPKQKHEGISEQKFW